VRKNVSKKINRICAVSVCLILSLNFGCSIFDSALKEQHYYTTAVASSGIDRHKMKRFGGSSGEPSPGIKGVYELASTGIVLAIMWAIPIYLIHVATD